MRPFGVVGILFVVLAASPAFAQQSAAPQSSKNLSGTAKTSSKPPVMKPNLTSGECTGMGGIETFSVDPNCKSECLITDKNGVLHKGCIDGVKH
jgi:hypothetical protein